MIFFTAFFLWFSCIGSVLYAQTQVPGEWIFSFENSGHTHPWDGHTHSWERVRSKLKTHYHFIRSFGPSQCFALFQAKDFVRGLPRDVPKGMKVQPNFVYSIFEADPHFDKQWGLKNKGQGVGELGPGIAGADVDALSAWQIFTGNRSVILALLDTGTDSLHSDLQKNRWKNEKEKMSNGIDDDGNGFVDDVEGWNFVEQNANVGDDNHHGTLIAGILGAETENGQGIRGILKETSLMTVKILDASGIGTSERAISGIEYAVRNGAKIINASWGARSFDQALFDSIRWAGEAGVFFVTAAGNSNNDNDTDSQPVYPASFKLPNVLSVLGLDPKNEKSPTSSYGRETTHIGAPGVMIYSTVPGNGYQFGNGTSFAAPFVAGAIALLKGFLPSLTNSEVKERLIQSTMPLHYYERDRSVSGGRLSLYNALMNIRPARHPEPAHWVRIAWSQKTPHPYENFTQLTWTLTHPGAKHLRVHFKNFQTEAGYDFFTLTDHDGRIVRIYSGDLGSFWSMDSLGDTLSLEFVADYVKSGYGLEIDSYEYSLE